MSLSLLLQQCPACLVRLAWIVFVMGGRWPYSWDLVGCCCQDLFNIARNWSSNSLTTISQLSALTMTKFIRLHTHHYYINCYKNKVFLFRDMG